MQIEKSIDVIEIRNHGRRMVIADETTEPWRPPSYPMFETHAAADEDCSPSKKNWAKDESLMIRP